MNRDDILRMMMTDRFDDRCNGISPDGAFGCTLFRNHHDQGVAACRNAGSYTGKGIPKVPVLWCNWCGVDVCERHNVSPPPSDDELDALWQDGTAP